MTAIVSADALERYVQTFNRNDHELYRQHIPNARALDWMKANIPRFACPDRDLEETYYFRWWTYRKHIRETPDGYVVTEFLPPVPWAGRHNAISCPAAHHFREGRWLRDDAVLRDYAIYWLRKGGRPRSYSFWIADSVLALSLVSGDRSLAVEWLPDLKSNYEAWETERRDANGLFWQVDDRDGMECSISGKRSPEGAGYRATINSYMFGDALAIAVIAAWAGRDADAQTYREKADEIKRLTEQHLWDESARFFKVLPRVDSPRLSDVRELHGYTPWYFNLPEASKCDAWSQLVNPEGFWAPYGPTTAERRHPGFSVSYTGHECQWNGPSWPFSTAVTLTAMSNLLNDCHQETVTREDYFRLLKVYTASHRMQLDDGREVPWIDENLNPFTGEWLARAFLKTWRDGEADPARREERGKDYNHSTYCDLIINGLVGLRPRADDAVEVNPLVPAAWDYFCLDGVRYHGQSITVLFDRTGREFGKGTGLHILADGRSIASAACLSRIRGRLHGAP